METIKLLPITRQGRTPVTPAYQTAGAAAMDLHAFLEAPITLEPGARALIPTGLCMEIPAGYGGFILARSGLSTRHGITMANGVGLIDSDYRGEVHVSLANRGDVPYTITDGERIAQFVLLATPTFAFAEADALSDTARGTGGFGSTGMSKL